MTVRLDEDGTIRLEGACPIEDADVLLQLRLAHVGAAVNWRDCEQAHAAVIQLLFVGDPTLIGPPAGEFLARMIAPLLIQPNGALDLPQPGGSVQEPRAVRAGRRKLTMSDMPMTYRVLIVDDSKLARMSIAKALGTLHPDWTRVEAANADEAAAIVARDKPDIALLDFNMPGRDGLELAAELHGLHPTMPLALISANVQDEIVARARAIGAAFLPKPLTEQALGEFLSGALLRLKTAQR